MGGLLAHTVTGLFVQKVDKPESLVPDWPTSGATLEGSVSGSGQSADLVALVEHKTSAADARQIRLRDTQVVLNGP